MGRELGTVAVLVDVDELRQLVVVDDRERQLHLDARLRSRFEQVALGADRRRQRRDELLADRVERRVCDLREHLLEVVEQHARAAGEHGDGRVGAHRPERLRSVARHRRHQELELLVGVAERLLPAHHRLVAVHDVLAVGQVVQAHQTAVEPLGIRMLGRELRLELLVVDDASLRGVDEEHAARLEPPLLHDARRVDVDHSGLARHDHAVVVGHPVAARSQAVAVEHGADHRTVGERDRRGTVPRLHERRVVPVEGALVGRHRRVVLPRLRDHHQDGVPNRTPAERQQLEALVEAHGVGGTGRDDRERALEPRHDWGTHHRLACAHPVAVALQRVDLAVVRDVAVRVRERPRRERVGGEPAVHERQRRRQAFVSQVGEELGELGRGEHPLVHEGPARQRREVHDRVSRRPAVGDLVLAPLAHQEQLAVERDARRTVGVVHEELPEARDHTPRRGPDQRVVDGNRPPAEHPQPLLGHDLLDACDGLLGVGGVEGQEGDTDAVRARRREVEAGHPPEEGVGHLDEDAGAVAGVRLGTRCAAVVEVAQRSEGGVDDVAAGTTLDVDHEGHTAGVVLEARVVEPRRLGETAERHPCGRGGIVGLRHLTSRDAPNIVEPRTPARRTPRTRAGAEGRRWPGCDTSD